jgi:rfaE bifunctional protein nucleotidyltransferase chain/domain
MTNRIDPSGTGATAPDPGFEAKCRPPQAAVVRAAELPRPLVFTNGCFDILHRGHVTYLAQARALGASLVVALNTDESVRRLGKGEDRPITALADRAAVIAALGSVDLVTWFDDDTPLALILALRPDVLVKGGDWQPDRIVGGREVRGWGGQVVSIPIRYARSTTEVLARIRGG